MILPSTEVRLTGQVAPRLLLFAFFKKKANFLNKNQITEYNNFSERQPLSRGILTDVYVPVVG